MKRELASSTLNTITIKYWGPIVCIAGALGVFGRDFPTLRFLPAIPLLLIAFFLASLAVVEVKSGVLRYRFLFRWRELRSENLIGAKLIWPPFIGSIQLKSPIFPWGRLYFVLDKNTESNLFRRGEFPIISFINSRGSHIDSKTSTPNHVSRLLSFPLIRAMGIGILSCLVFFYLTPGDYLQGRHFSLETGMPMVLRIQFELVKWLQALPLQLAGLVFITYLAIRRRRTADAWLYGFISGFGFAGIVIRLWR